MRKIIAALLLMALLLVAAAGAYRAVHAGRNALLQGPTAPWPELLPMAAATPLSNRVILIIVDGLRTEAIGQMPLLSRLRDGGAYFVLQVPEPAWPDAVRVTLLAGSPPWEHGVITADPGAPASADNLLAAVRRRGLQAAVAAAPDWQALFRPWLDAGLFSAGTPDAATARALLSGADALVILHHSGPVAAAAVDAWLAQTLDDVSLQHSTVLVTGAVGAADLAAPNQTGPDVVQVPLILAGAGVRPLTQATARLEDVAPTAAALLGLPLPAGATGQPLWPALDMSADQTAAWLQQVVAVQAAHTAAYVAALGGNPGAATLGEPDRQSLTRLQRQRQEARLAAAEAGRRERLPFAAGAAALLLSYLLLLVWQPYRTCILFGAGTYVLAVHLLFWARGGVYAYSLDGLADLQSPLLLTHGGEAAVAMALAVIVAGWRLARSAAPHPTPGLVGLHVGLAVMALLAAEALLGYLWFGWPPQDVHILPAWAIKGVVDLSGGVAIGCLAPLWFLLGTVTTRSIEHWLLAGADAPDADADEEEEMPKTEPAPMPASAPVRRAAKAARQNKKVIPFERDRRRTGRQRRKKG